ncbi:MAG: DUF378 domain-containing protein [Candidatus Levybacteria bacterium]|nr:DUF378 domain-containing protein [Candidatus Levybacteria bacterium]
MKSFETLAGWLLVLGGVSLGLDGLMSYPLLDSVLGMDSTVERVVNIAIGVAAVMMAYKMLGMKKK